LKFLLLEYLSIRVMMAGTARRVTSAATEVMAPMAAFLITPKCLALFSAKLSKLLRVESLALRMMSSISDRDRALTD
jgi:hypothetical protein